MASITYDSQSFLIDGRRIFLVGGTIDYARVRRDQWAARIMAAKQAGLNTITTNIVWSRHEARPNSFDFQGENDLRAFVQLVGAAGMYCILRIGPFIGSGYDLGGLPVWLLSLKDVKLRTANTAFLEATSRFFNAVANQVRDLQATATETGPGGPVILVQAESAWTCGDDALAPQYLGEIGRYLRESGFDVPILNANNLWQGLESEIDTWTGSSDMLSTLRQLTAVRSSIPRMVGAFTVGQAETWGAAPRANPAIDSNELQRELTEIIAAAGQFNIEPFCGGTNFGFSAGRSPQSFDAYYTTSNDQSAPLTEAGTPGALFHPLRRVAMFASRFARVLSNLEPKRAGVSLVPESVFSVTNPKLPSTGHVVSYAAGSQGSVAFVYGSRIPGPGPAGERPAQLLMNDGSTLPAYLGQNQVTWCLFDVRLAGRSQLNYCNLSPFALVGKVFVIAGPAGSPVRLAINDAPLETNVPTGDEPEAIEHENILVVICRDEMLPKLLVSDDAVYLGADDLAVTGEPIVYKADREVVRYSASGEVSTIKYHLPQPPRKVKVTRTVNVPPAGKAKGKKPMTTTITEEVMQESPASPVLLAARPKSPAPPTLTPWLTAEQTEYTAGTSARFASIAGPADLATLGAPYGYGWYRCNFKPPAAGKTLVASPGSGDRLHLFISGQDAGVIGVGPGASGLGDATISFRKKEQSLVILAENLGRASGGQQLGEPKGIVGPIWEIKPARALSKATTRTDRPLEAFSFRTPLFDVHSADVTEPERTAWTWSGKRKHTLLMTISLPPGAPHRGLIILNEKPIAFFDGASPRQLTIDPELMARGDNTLELALLTSARADRATLIKSVEFYDQVTNLTQDAQWAFAKWETPIDSAFKPLRAASKGPSWSKARFSVPAAPGGHSHGFTHHLNVSLNGLSKGQIYVNGRHVGRFFNATGKGKPVGPHATMLVPSSFLIAGSTNEIAIFDEHGFSPSKVKLTYVV